MVRGASVEFYDDGTPRVPARAWWRRLRFVLPWVRLPGYNLEHGSDTSASASDPQYGRNQPVAERSEPPEAPTTA
jgi:hypothetical protein